MKKLKLLYISLLCACMIIGVMPSANVQAADDGTAVILTQEYSTKASGVGSLFYDTIAFDMANLNPTYTYDIYYKKYGAKKYRFYKSYSAKGNEEDAFWETYMAVSQIRYHNVHRMWLTRTAANTKYCIRVKTRETGRWSKTGTFWSAAKNPKYKRNGRRLTWSKTKGAAGYIAESRKYVWYEWHDGVPVYYGNYKFNDQVLSANKRSILAPNGYSARSVYAYTKHGKYYYVDGYGCFKNKKELKIVPGFPEEAYKLRRRVGLDNLIYY